MAGWKVGWKVHRSSDDYAIDTRGIEHHHLDCEYNTHPNSDFLQNNIVVICS